MTKKKEKKEEKFDPAQENAKPRAENQMFTVHENKLLDQITIEVIEAWKKDLATIKKTHEKVLALVSSFDFLEEKIEDFLAVFDRIEQRLNKKRWWKFWK